MRIEPENNNIDYAKGLRRVENAGTAPTITLSSSPSWGTSPSSSVTAGSTTLAGVVTVTAGSGSPGASPTVTVTFAEPFEDAPIAMVNVSGGTGYVAGTTGVTWTTSTTALTITLGDTPAAAETFIFNWIVFGHDGA